MFSPPSIYRVAECGQLSVLHVLVAIVNHHIVGITAGRQLKEAKLQRQRVVAAGVQAPGANTLLRERIRVERTAEDAGQSGQIATTARRAGRPRRGQVVEGVLNSIESVRRLGVVRVGQGHVARANDQRQVVRGGEEGAGRRPHVAVDGLGQRGVALEDGEVRVVAVVEGKGREVERNLVARRHDNPNGAAAGAVNVIGIRPVAIVGVAAVHAVQRLIAQRRVVGHSKASVLALQPSISQLAVGKHLVVIADALSGRRRGVSAKGETNLLGGDNLHRAGGGAQRDRLANHSVIAVVSLLHQLHVVAAAAVQV